jgi:hypothetical protein
MVFGTPPMTACVIFCAYELMVGRLAATLAFTTLSLFNILRFPLVVLPKVRHIPPVRCHFSDFCKVPCCLDKVMHLAGSRFLADADINNHGWCVVQHGQRAA